MKLPDHVYEFVSITNNIADTHTNTCDMYKSRQRHTSMHDPVISSQNESYTRYIFFFYACLALSVGRSSAYFAQNARCTVTTDLLVWYSNKQNDFSPWAAIFSLHTLASRSGRNVNYDKKKQRTAEKHFWVVPSICSGFVNICPTGFL
jgi:hypothetical protein